MAFAQIDWQDFVVVETIDFTSADESLELPAPSSVAQMESMTLAQKKMASMVMESEVAPGGSAGNDGKDTEDVPAGGEEEDGDMEMDMEEEEEESAEPAVTAPQQQPPPAQAAPQPEPVEKPKEVQKQPQAAIKIRKDYVPKCTSSALALSRLSF